MKAFLGRSLIHTFNVSATKLDSQMLISPSPSNSTMTFPEEAAP
jgi:hypothetical protein